MASPLVGIIVWLVVMVTVIVALVRRKTRLRGRIGPGAAGTVYELLNEDKRNAIELIVDERTGERDPEDADGDLPQLKNPKASNRRP